MYDNLNIGDTVYLLQRKICSKNRLLDIKTGVVFSKKDSSISVEVNKPFATNDYVQFQNENTFSDFESVDGIIYELFSDKKEAQNALNIEKSIKNMRQEVEEFVLSATPKQLEAVYTYFLKEREKL